MHEQNPFEVELIADLAVKSDLPDLAPVVKTTVPEMIKILKLSFQPELDDPDLGAIAVQALGDVEKAASLAISVLERFAQDDNSLAQEEAERVLKEFISAMRTALEEAIPALEEAAKHGDSRVATEAKEVLVRIKRTLDVKLQEPTVEDDKE